MLRHKIEEAEVKFQMQDIELNKLINLRIENDVSSFIFLIAHSLSIRNFRIAIFNSSQNWAISILKWPCLFAPYRTTAL